MRILAGGCFNTIHLGHVYFFKQCQKRSKSGQNVFIVLTHPSNNQKRNIIAINDRINNLANLKIIPKKNILKGYRRDFTKWIRLKKPSMICLGYDQKLPRGVREFVNKRGIQVSRISELKGYSKKDNKVIGRIFSGQGVGAKFLAKSGYKTKLYQNFKRDFFKGTLNISLCRRSIADLINPKKVVKIAGFKDNNKKFGALKIFPVTLIRYKKLSTFLQSSGILSLQSIRAWVVRPQKTRYNSNIIEIIHPQNLRQTFDFKDNDLVEVIF